MGWIQFWSAVICYPYYGCHFGFFFNVFVRDAVFRCHFWLQFFRCRFSGAVFLMGGIFGCSFEIPFLVLLWWLSFQLSFLRDNFGC